EPAPKVMQALQEACSAFFSPLRVVVARSRPESKARGGRGMPLPELRFSSGTPREQLVSEDILDWLAGGLRSDSVLTAAFTLSPVINCGKPTVGATDWSRRVGVFSLSSILNSE
ncbi:CRYD, partial [Symbiodinium sp. CCMP2456]